jgi:hypothetical protein
MIRRILRLGLILVFGSSALPGCETLQHNARTRSEDDEPIATEAKSADSSDSSPAKGFFKPSRLSGAWSSEAREVERDLGVH